MRLLDEGGYFDAAYDDGPPSPCISVCRMDAGRRFCEGCLRSIDEIRAWSRSDAAGRRAIWARIAARAGAEVPALATAG
nr:DUF1289 domain-containing protein [Xylophilus sp.]